MKHILFFSNYYKKNLYSKEADNKPTDVATSKDTIKEPNMDIKSSNQKKDTAKTIAKECKTSKDKSKAYCNDSKPTIAEERKRFLGRNKKMTLPKEIVVTSGMDSGISKWLKKIPT